jgi:predicted dehydrogenase/threonine dehydrogenase-like Zn-dependent dehydrogenase
MRQVLVRRGRIATEHVPAPLVEPGHVLVEVAYSLISSGTEQATVRSSAQPLLARAVEKPQRLRQLADHLRQQGIQRTLGKVQAQLSQLGTATPLGYSCAGVVVQVGEGATGFAAGDLVACAGAGLANHAEIVLVPQNLTCKVPEGCDLRAAATVALGAIALQGIRRAQPALGETVAVLGLGLVGQITVQLLRAAGCHVVGMDIDARRVELARASGAEHAYLSTDGDASARVALVTEGHGADATIITASSRDNGVVQQAMQMTREKGRVVVVGDVGLGLSRSPFYEKELDLLISRSYGPGRYDERYELQGQDYPLPYVRWTEGRNMAEYLRLIARGRVDVAALLERELDVSQADAAYRALTSGEERPIGVLLRYPAADAAPRERSERTAGKERSVALSGATRPARAPGSAPVSVAIVGAGEFARGVHLPNLRALPGVSLRSVASGTGLRAAEVGRQFGAQLATTDYQEVLADPAVDAVLVCTRHHLHAGITLDALRAGKHVLVEKPLALTEDELQGIEAFYAAQDTARPSPILLTGFNRRFSPHARRLRALVGTRSQPMLLSYRMNAGYLPPSHWVHGPEGGGRNIGEACHAYDLFTYLVGAPVEHVDVTQLSPQTGPYSGRDNFVATFRFSEGSVASLTYTALGAPSYPKEQLDVFLEGSVLSMTDFARLSVVGRGSSSTVNGDGDGGRSLPDKGHAVELEAFFGAIRSGDWAWPVPLWEQAQATRMSFAVEQCLVS